MLSEFSYYSCAGDAKDRLSPAQKQYHTPATMMHQLLVSEDSNNLSLQIQRTCKFEA